jgi:hypothetical protein
MLSAFAASYKQTEGRRRIRATPLYSSSTASPVKFLECELMEHVDLNSSLTQDAEETPIKPALSSTLTDAMSDGLPRSVVRPNAYQLLDGVWGFALDLSDKGLSERWYLGHEYQRAAQWPGSIEAHMAEAKEAAATRARVARFNRRVV